MFKIDTREWKKLQRELKRLAKQTPRAIRGMLNDMAFNTRNTAIENIENTMTMRNRRYIHSQLRVTKSTQGRNYAQVGSIAGGPGFLAQEIGGDSNTLSHRQVTKAARNSNIKRKVAPSARLRSHTNFPKPSDMRGVKNPAIALVRRLSRAGFRKPFIIKDHPNAKPGLYKLKGRRNKQKLIMLQSFDRGTKAKKRPWMKTAASTMYRRWNSQRAWRFHMKMRGKL